MKARYIKYVLDFKKPAGTSRGILNQKDTYYIIVSDENHWAIGECGILKGLSMDDVPAYESQLQWVCDNIHFGKQELWNQLRKFPSIQFGVEQVFSAFEAKQHIYSPDNLFTQGKEGIDINGLVWMGSPVDMKTQIDEKIAQGFRCIKMKIGAIDFAEEYKLLQYIRTQYSQEQLELRVDANGAFSFAEVGEVLQQLADLNIHSIEQPIKAGNVLQMKQLCESTLLPIALDEELIGITNPDVKRELLQLIQPQYIILKPSLIGGIRGSQEWIDAAEELNIGWWITSALESNIGLNAIAQFTHKLNNPLPQGLGTGSLYINNISSPLQVAQGKLWHQPSQEWEVSDLLNNS